MVLNGQNLDHLNCKNRCNSLTVHGNVTLTDRHLLLADHPNKKEETIDLSPHELISQIITDEKKTLKLLEDVEELIDEEIPK